MGEKTEALLARARGGGGDAFTQLTDRYRVELLAHCYRMLGSLPDAEDALQETLVSAWQSLAGFEERSSVRTWLYRIATNRCLNIRRAAVRRAGREWTAAFELPEPNRVGEVWWLTPLPDRDIEGLGELGPSARHELKESVSLAFVTALQRLPPRQLAVVVLRDVLEFSAAEVAEMLQTTVQAVHSALKRARSNLDRASGSGVREPDSTAEAELLARLVAAFDARDLDGLIALLTDDAFVSMPPAPYEYVGVEAVRRFYGTFFDAGRTTTLVPTGANLQPAYGMYALGADGVRHGIGVLVVTVDGNRIGGMTRFENTLLTPLGLPAALG